MRTALLSLALVTLSLVALAPTARSANEVHLVDVNIGGAAALQTAIDAAGDGDVIIVGPGLYGSCNVNGKSLTVVADDEFGPVAAFISRARITNLAAGQRVTVRGIEFIAGAAFIQPFETIHLANNAGTVHFERCVFRAPVQPAPTVRALNSASVFLTRCTATGMDGTAIVSGNVTSAQAAIAAQDSNLFLHECTATGGKGHAATAGNPFVDPPLPGQDGAQGVTLENSQLFASGCTLRGGAGGNNGIVGGCLGAGDGGAGVRMAAGANVVRLLETTTLGGAGGTHPTCPHGSAGPGVDPASGVLIHKVGAARELLADAVVREGQTLDLEARGQPLETFLLLFSPAHLGVYAPGLQGALLPGTPLGLISLGALPPSGVLQVSIPVTPGTLPPSVDGAELLLQGLVAAPNGLGLLSSPTSSTLVKGVF
jgi:hypothetical protein